MDALLLAGRPGVGSAQISARGHFRYLTDFIPLFDYSMLLVFAESDPVLWEPNELACFNARRHSWITDVRVAGRNAEFIVSELDRRIGRSGSLGTGSLNSLPAGVWLELQQGLPAWGTIELTRALVEIQNPKSEEEIRCLKEAARVNDSAYVAMLGMLQPGVSEERIVGALDGHQRSQGADQTFNQVSSGRFPSRNRLYHPSQRRLERGDVLCVELSTVYAGYWNQIVRAVCIGRMNRDLATMHEACIAVRLAGIEAMKPTVPADRAVALMTLRAKELGFVLRTPVGHFCGLDLVDERINPGVDLAFVAGTTLIVHPILENHVGDTLFWGETYIVEADRTVALNRATDELLVVG